MSDNNSNSGCNGFYLIFATITAVIGYHIHGGFFWTVCNFLFWPLSWVKWLVCQDVNITIIKGAFSFFFQ